MNTPRPARNMQFKSRLTALMASSLLVIAAACASLPPPALKQLTGTTELVRGESGFIRWDFAPCDSVRLQDHPGAFPPRHELHVQPVATQVYNLTAYHGKDSLPVSWTITVTDPPMEPEPEIAESGPRSYQAPDVPPCHYLYQSTLPSQYMIGYRSGNEVPRATRLKVLRVSHTPEQIPERIMAIVLDENGNFLPGFGGKSANWNLLLQCRGANVEYAIPVEPRAVISTESSQLSIAICADYASYMAAYQPHAYQAYQDFMCSAAPDDEVSFIPFDHRIKPEFIQASGADARNMLSTTTLPELGGLTALYKSAYYGLGVLQRSTRPDKALVLVTGGNEDASLVYTINDVARLAREHNIAIYPIALGAGADTYPLRYLARYSGGQYYQVEKNEIGELRRILNEIGRLYKTHYEIDLQPYRSQIENLMECESGFGLEVSMESTEVAALHDSRRVNIPMVNYDPHHQVVAIFDHSDTQPDSPYLSQLDNLADILNKNPDKVIEIIGHASLDGSDFANRNISMQRARAVRSWLLSHNVSPKQIRLRASGALTPVYFLERTGWQAQKNRRVEIRWLDPKLRPYELLAQVAYTEEEAISAMEEWENRGIDAYYEPIMLNKVVAFRVKLWGYAGYQEALAARSRLQSQYGTKLEVQ